MRLRVRVVGLVVIVSAAAVMAACSSPSAKSSSTAPTTSASSPVPTTSASSAPPTTAAASGNFNSCSVVTQAEAASAIGAAVSAGVPGNATVEGGLACVFYGNSAPTPRNPNVSQPDSVRVVVVKGADALKWYNDYKSKVPAKPIAGYGDQAYWDGYASLSVLKGDYYLRIAVAPAGAAPSLSDEKALATAILPGL